MIESAEPEIPAAVRRLAGELGLTPVHRLAGGEWGAYLVTDADNHTTTPLPVRWK
jgi:hypothetical protein